MANIRAEDILKLNPNASRVSLMSEWATEPYDCHPFILRPPPTRPEAERKSICVDSVLCDTCRVSLEYIAYILERYNQDGDDREYLREASAITHHRDLNSLRTRAHCHICNWLVRYVGLPGTYEKDGEGEAEDVVLANTQIELCWDPEFAIDKKEEDFGRPRLYFAQFDPRQKRASANYDTIMRLQIWPSLKSANLLAEDIQTSSDCQGDDRQGQTLRSTPSPCEQDTDGKPENGQRRKSVPLESGSHLEDLRDRSGRESNASPEESTPLSERHGHHGEKNEQSRSPTSCVSLESGNQESDLEDHSDRDSRSQESDPGDFADHNSRALGTESIIGDGGSEHYSNEDDHSSHQSPPESSASAEPDDSGFWKCGFTGSLDSRRMAVNWLSRCQKNEDGMHDACNETDDTWLPTRLLDVEHALKYNRVRLVTPSKTEGAFETDRSYITLSHCWGAWGSRELPVLSTKNEDERHHVGIDLKELPETFCHAIYVAAWFQVRWLWIDSLCIIQDSAEDWTREASRMHLVYKRGLLNISADSAADARAGLFNPRDPLIIKPLKWEVPGIERTFHLTLDDRTSLRWLRAHPLPNRAWVFQERQLSRRILHFTEFELAWECCAEGSSIATETFPRGAPFDVVSFNKQPKIQSAGLLSKSRGFIDQPLRLWSSVCEMYSEKQLTKQEDKLVALAGLSQEFQMYLPDDYYVAGLWRSTLPQSLLWALRRSGKRVESQVPSWSWASTEGLVQMNNESSARSPTSPVCRVLDVQHSLPDSHKGPQLVLSGFLRRVKILRSFHELRPTWPPSHRQFQQMSKEELFIVDRDYTVPYRGRFSCSVDVTDAQAELIEAHYLFVEVSKDSMRGLLLQQTGQPDHFVRAGILETYKKSNVLIFEERNQDAQHSVLGDPHSKRKKQDECPTAPSEVLSESGNADSDAPLPHEQAAIGGITQNEEQHWQSTRANVLQTDADITQVLYDDADGVLEPPFERLAPQVIKLM